MQRAVKGEVIASTFDRPADDHTTVAGWRSSAPSDWSRWATTSWCSSTRSLAWVAPTTSRPRERPHPLRWRGRCRALPAEEVLRCCPQHRERWLAHHLGHRACRDRLADGRGDLRGVQGHRQHGLKLDRGWQTVVSSRPSTSTTQAPAARRSSSRPKNSRSCGSSVGSSRPWSRRPASSCSSIAFARPRRTTSSSSRSSRRAASNSTTRTMPDPRPTSQSTMASRQFDASRAELTGAVVGAGSWPPPRVRRPATTAVVPCRRRSNRVSRRPAWPPNVAGRHRGRVPGPAPDPLLGGVEERAGPTSTGGQRREQRRHERKVLNGAPVPRIHAAARSSLGIPSVGAATSTHWMPRGRRGRRPARRRGRTRGGGR